MQLLHEIYPFHIVYSTLTIRSLGCLFKSGCRKFGKWKRGEGWEILEKAEMEMNLTSWFTLHLSGKKMDEAWASLPIRDLTKEENKYYKKERKINSKRGEERGEKGGE